MNLQVGDLIQYGIRQGGKLINELGVITQTETDYIVIFFPFKRMEFSFENSYLEERPTAVRKIA